MHPIVETGTCVDRWRVALMMRNYFGKLQINDILVNGLHVSTLFDSEVEMHIFAIFQSNFLYVFEHAFE